MKLLTVVLLLVVSNIIMTFAWYWHIKSGNNHFPLWKLILISWSIALFEYAFAVPANHMGASWNIKPFQLKIIQEVITLVIFTVFAITYLKQDFSWNYVYSFLFILGAVYFAFKK